MEVKIFVDVLFIINFIIDYTLLSLTSVFVKKTPKVLKLGTGSFVGAIFATFAFFIPMNAVVSLVSTAGVAFLMVTLTFGVKKASLLLKNTAIFYLVCMASSGVSFALIFSGRAENMAVNNGIFYANINAYSLLLAFILTLIIIHTATGYIRKQKIKASFLYNVTIERNGNVVSDTALFDSGNFIKDPISQKSVIVAEWKSVSSLFEENKLTEAIVNNPKDFVYIGCRGFGSDLGMYAFSPDKVFSDEIVFSEPVLVAICDMPLDKEGSYRMLLPNTSKIQAPQERI